jgi:superfamily I DNA and RNA helicase
LRGECREGEFTIIERPAENSPLSISNNQTKEELIEGFVAEDMKAEIAWIVAGIRGFMAEGLRADDIMVISLDDYNARTYFQEIARALMEFEIRTVNAQSNPFSAPAFLLENHVTLSTVYRAKGNEAAVVFALGLDAIYPDRKQKRARNKLFTAFTRAKAWLRVSGMGDGAEHLLQELEIARDKAPRLEFVYPDPRKVELLQRDLSDKASKLRDLAEATERQLDQLELDKEERETFLGTLLPKKK